jgi:hypothetical protein
MEAMRRRFAKQRDLNHLSQGSETTKVESHPASRTQSNRTSSKLTMDLSISKHVELSDGNVLLFDSTLGVTDVSKSSAPDAKIATLEAMNEFIRRSGRENLDLVRETPVVKRIIQTFESRNSCLKAVQNLLSNDANRETLIRWTTDIWGEDKEEPDRDTGSAPASPRDSVFSDYEVEEIADNRVRPITLRPRRTPAPTVVVKSEFRKIQPAAPNQDREEIKPSPLRSATGRFRAASPRRRNRGRSPDSLYSTGKPKLKSVRSSPTLRHKSSRPTLRDEYSSECSKKRAFLDNLPPELRPEGHQIKRNKSAEGIWHIKIEEKGTSNPFALKSGSKNFPEAKSLVKAIDQISQPNTAASMEDNKEYVSRFWRETASTFPPAVQKMSTVDHLAYFFRDIESLRKENELIKRDELERRKSMLLLAEKLKLMNQPVLRFSKSNKLLRE